MAWGDMAKFSAYQVVMPKCFTKAIPADGLELTNSTWGARLPIHVKIQGTGRKKMSLENNK